MWLGQRLQQRLREPRGLSHRGDARYPRWSRARQPVREPWKWRWDHKPLSCVRTELSVGDIGTVFMMPVTSRSSKHLAAVEICAVGFLAAVWVRCTEGYH